MEFLFVGLAIYSAVIFFLVYKLEQTKRKQWKPSDLKAVRTRVW